MTARLANQHQYTRSINEEWAVSSAFYYSLGNLASYLQNYGLIDSCVAVSSRLQYYYSEVSVEYVDMSRLAQI